MAKYKCSEKTKTALLEAAAELFAQKGVAGASVRDIVKKAQTPLSSVNYYFGSKEQLYLETIKYVLTEKFAVPDLLSKVLGLAPKTPLQMAQALCIFIDEMFHRALLDRNTQWDGKFIGRVITDKGQEEHELITAIVPLEKLEALMLENCPEADITDVNLAIVGVFGQVSHMTMAKISTLHRLKTETYDAGIVKRIVAFQQKAILSALKLPIPDTYDKNIFSSK